MEICDLTHDEAIEFLCKKRAINEADAHNIYTLVGGRIGLLVRAVNNINSRQNQCSQASSPSVFCLGRDGRQIVVRPNPCPGRTTGPYRCLRWHNFPGNSG